MSNLIPKIPAAEWELMEVLWVESGLTGAEVHERLEKEDRALKTTNTLLGRLVGRGVLAAERQGRAFRYTPVLERTACVRKESLGFVRRVLRGQWSPLVLQLVEQADLDDKDIAELEKLLAEKRRKTNPRKMAHSTVDSSL